MKKIVLILPIFWSTLVFSQECGTYLFKGILREDKNQKLSYIVNVDTASQMKFEIPNEADLIKLSLVQDMPSSFQGVIYKKMDGTNGVVRAPTEISKRFPDPLKTMDTGIFLIKAQKCD